MTMSFTNATPLLGDPAALRRQARETGYLFLRNVVDADLVRDLRRGIFGILADFGCLDARAQPDDGIIAAEWLSNREDFYGSGVPERVYTRIQQLEAEHKELERQVAEWKAKCEAIEKRESERRAIEEKKHSEEVQYLKDHNKKLKNQLNSFLAPGSK